MLSAAVALLELAGGGGEFDSNGNLEVTEDHVQAGLLLVTFSALAVQLQIVCASRNFCSWTGGRPPGGVELTNPGSAVWTFGCCRSCQLG